MPATVEPEQSKTATKTTTQEMTAQSQGRNCQKKRKRAIEQTHRGKSPNRKKQKAQRDLAGGMAFVPEQHCRMCKAQEMKKRDPNVKLPHKPHHERCPKNQRTRGVSEAFVENRKAERDLERELARPFDKNNQFLTQGDIDNFFVHKQPGAIPPEQSLKPQASNLDGTAAVTEVEQVVMNAACLPENPKPVATKPALKPPPQSNKNPNAAAPMSTLKPPPPPPQRQPTSETETDASFCIDSLAHYLCDAVAAAVKDVDREKKSDDPLAMLAVASAVTTLINSGWPFRALFTDGMTMTIPYCSKAYENPFYHSIVGQKLLYVDWLQSFPGHTFQCPNCRHQTFTNDCNRRTLLSKRGKLFPIFRLDGAPSWAVVQQYKCNSCKRTVKANDGDLLCRLPAYMADLYPVEPKYAQPNNRSHIGRDATAVIEQSMVTYANGEFCSRLLMNAINDAYLRRARDYYSYHNVHTPQKAATVPDYPPKDLHFIPIFPPQGDTVRDLYETAALSTWTASGISDKDRHIREIQGVKCNLIFAQDHTHSVVKNYSKIGAKALWDVMTETGEIASAVLVDDTKSRQFAHAAEQLARRPGFAPTVMYSDTWPNKQDFWALLFGSELQGRLGLFHFVQRITQTMRQTHIDFSIALHELLACIYEYDSQDLGRLIAALKAGKIGADKHAHTSAEIEALMKTKRFRKTYGKFLRKKIHNPEVIGLKLDKWFVDYKCQESEGQEKARGRRDPVRNETLFTSSTKDALLNCKKACEYIQDVRPIQEMYNEVETSKKDEHGCISYTSKRGESTLESFHDRVAHFANGGMRPSLADILNLRGTAQYNRTVRHKRKAIDGPKTNRPAGWRPHVDYFDHCDLDVVNKLATDVGLSAPFPDTEKLGEYTGEKFFSEYLVEQKWRNASYPPHRLNDRCQCPACASNSQCLPHNGSIIQAVPVGSPAAMACQGQDAGSVATNPRTVAIQTFAGLAQSEHQHSAPPLLHGSPSKNPRQQLQLPSPMVDTPLIDRALKQPPRTTMFCLPTWQSSLAVSPFSHLPPPQLQPAPFQFYPPPLVLLGQGLPRPASGRPRKQREYCGNKFMEWASRNQRKGRPPHEAGCASK